MMLAMVMIMQSVVSVGVTADFSVFSGNFGYENFYNLSNDSGDTNPLDANGGETDLNNGDTNNNINLAGTINNEVQHVINYSASQTVVQRADAGKVIRTYICY